VRTGSLKFPQRGLLNVAYALRESPTGSVSTQPVFNTANQLQTNEEVTDPRVLRRAV
jgi:hypothetical protein